MPEAARITDRTAHGAPLGPGTASPNVNIGRQKAWRALPAGSTAAAVESVANAISQFMSAPSLTPAQAAAQLAQIQAGLQQAGATAASEGNPSAASAATGATTGLASTNAALTATWTTASAPPGAMPAATAAYTEGIKAALASAAGAVFSAIAGAADMHNCPRPCPNPLHGPGVVTRGSKSVRINGLPAARKGDKVIEACGGSDAIAAGCTTVNIGDLAGGGGGAGDESDSQAAAVDDAAEAVVEALMRGVMAAVSAVSPAQLGPLLPPVTAAATAAATWIGIVLRDFDGTPMPNQDFTVALRNGVMLAGRTDAKGYMRFDGVWPGSGKVIFNRIPDAERRHGRHTEHGDGNDDGSARAGRRPPPRPSFDW